MASEQQPAKKMDDVSAPQPSQAAAKGPKPSESKRMRMQHDVVKDAMGGKLVLAPIDLTRPGGRILDSATGNGKSSESRSHRACAS